MAKRLERVGAQTGIHATLCLLRHTAASWWVQGGVPIAKVAAWLGHAPNTCTRHYAGLQRGFDPDVDRRPAA
jgi:integrase